jgi:signal recognition particle receptor subunit beta
MEVKIPGSAIGQPESRSKAVAITEVPGHYHFKEKLINSLEEAKAIVVVVDSKDKDKFNEAAEIIYEILNNITIQSERVPILVACNKQDL